MFERITFDTKIMAGKACIRGMRIPVSASGKKIPSVISFRLRNTRTLHVIERVMEKIIQSYRIGKITLLQRKRHIPFEARDVSMYILKTYTGLKNKAIGEMFGVSTSAVNKASLRINTLSKESKNFRIEKIVFSAFKV